MPNWMVEKKNFFVRISSYVNYPLVVERSLAKIILLFYILDERREVIAWYSCFIAVFTIFFLISHIFYLFFRHAEEVNDRLCMKGIEIRVPIIEAYAIFLRLRIDFIASFH